MSLSSAADATNDAPPLAARSLPGGSETATGDDGGHTGRDPRGSSDTSALHNLADTSPSVVLDPTSIQRQEESFVGAPSDHHDLLHGGPYSMHSSPQTILESSSDMDDGESETNSSLSDHSDNFVSTAADNSQRMWPASPTTTATTTGAVTTTTGHYRGAQHRNNPQHQQPIASTSTPSGGPPYPSLRNQSLQQPDSTTAASPTTANVPGNDGGSVDPYHNPSHAYPSRPLGNDRLFSRAGDSHTPTNDHDDLGGGSSNSSSTRRRREQVQMPRRIYGDGNFGIGSGYKSSSTRLSLTERAIKRWRNLNRQDEFFQKAYAYYVGKGFMNIVLSRVLNLATMIFVVSLCTFLFGCVDHSLIRSHKSLSAIIIPQCTSKFSYTSWVFLTLFLAVWCSQIIMLALDIPSLLELRAFYTHVLSIPPEDIATVTWNEVMKQMIDLRNREIALEQARKRRARLAHYKLDAQIIINRIMRKENYTIALFNKDVLDTSLDLFGHKTSQSFSKTIEWNVFFCLISYVFDERGQIRKRFLYESNREVLSEG
ncbi:autophagy protein atg9 [Spiromyces aspiralis]|uniref:Autophagy protein atg9 n=1 Tax=Spiromyces aspiralis TaxID=68401 RepID=A0ACC1HUV0_9FUNG|nr:autophagy protein atg9 [Spiromyces aspiralis]